MADRLEVYIDKNDIIHQIFEGFLVEDDALKLEKETERLVAILKNPSKVRIFVDSTKERKVELKARKILMANLKRDNVYKLAVWGAHPFTHGIVNLFRIAAKISKIRSFKDRDEAYRWLLE